MKKSGRSNENSIWFQYALIVLGSFASLAILTYFSFQSITSMARDDADVTAQTLIESDAEILNSFVGEGRHKLEMVCRLTEYIWQEKQSIAEVESLFVLETERFRAENNLNYSGLFGVIGDHFVDGGKKVADPGYDPKKRPWYRSAIRSLNDDAHLTTFVDYKNGSELVTLSKVLPDKKSVIALNLSLNVLRDVFHTRWEQGSRWMVLSTSGEVIGHFDVTQIGENYLSSKYWGTENEELARKALRTANEKVRVVQIGNGLVAYVVPIQNQWFLVKIYDRIHLADDVRWTTTRNIMMAVLLFAIMILIVSIVFVRHRRLVRENRVKKFLRIKLDHEMHATINGILGMNAVVMKSIHDEDVRSFSEGVQSAVEGFDFLLKDVREIADNDGAIVVESQEYSFFEILSECYKIVLPKARMKNLQVTFECDPDIPSGMWGDALHLRQVISNLLADAVRRTESGSIWVSVNGFMEPRRSTSTEDYFTLQISIRDTGTSVERGHSPNVDEWQDSSAELCLAKLMLDACGGELTIKSRYGEGTSFMVSLRQLVLNKAPIGDFEARFDSLVSKESQNTITLFAPAARVLVVDDVEMNLKVVCGLLKETKVQIDTAVSGSQCLELVASRHYDLILLDYSLPEMNGVETFDRMKKVGAKLNMDTPVIIVTAETVDFKGSFLKIGLTDYMVKPYAEKDLLRILAWYLPKELVLTQDDLQEFPKREKSKPAAKPAKVEEIPEEEEIVFHTILTPEEKLNVFKDVLNVQKGLEYFSRDVRCYFEVVKEFAHEDKRYGFDKTFQMKDWNNYLILIHSVNGVAQAIGADDLAEISQAVEKACKDYMFDTLDDLHRAFIAAYVKTIDVINKGVADYED
ncbi:MAG: response regulator [Fibrobacter sp.]|nr:response regulator [Fibrobacter sp.]